MDRIALEGMVFSGRHGVRPAEREQTQEFKVDVKLDTDLLEAGRSDRVEDTVDYRRVYAIAKDVVEGESVQLIETLAQRIAERAVGRSTPKVSSASATALPTRPKPHTITCPSNSRGGVAGSAAGRPAACSAPR